MKARFIIPLFLFHIICLLATDEPSEPLPLANTESGGSSVIAGCVNAITGSFFECDQDLCVAGAKPLTLERCYFGSTYLKGDMQRGWLHNHESSLVAWEDYRKKFIVAYVEPSASTTFYGESARHAGKVSLPFHHDWNNCGLTNCGCSIICGQTNLKNNTLSLDKNNHNVMATTGCGCERQYHRFSKNTPYHITHERCPNGHALIYSYDSAFRLSEVKAVPGDKGTPFGSLKFGAFSTDPRNQSASFDVLGSDGRAVKYFFTKVIPTSHEKKRKIKERFLLTKVQRPGFSVDYVYKKAIGGFSDLMTKKVGMDGRFLEMEYYEGSKEKHINHRVKALRAPVGTGSNPVTIYSFKYIVNADKYGILTGPCCTEVYDALNGLQKIHYSKDHRLTSIERFTGTKQHKLYSRQTLYWGDNASADWANQISRTFEQADGTCVSCQWYKYDAKGNVLEERIYGNLSGKNDKPLVVQENGSPHANGCEYRSTCYTYSQDKFNLLLSRIEAKKTEVYTYRPGTNLKTAGYIKVGAQIVKRELFNYNNDGILVCQIVDDGFAENASDCRGVTERRITHITPRTSAPVGYPESIRECYYDPATGRECLLKRLVNTHSKEGWLLRQDVYDNEDQFVYSLHWKYDESGRITSETNALGQEWVRKYDKTGNLIYEQSPRRDMHKEMVYDFANRLIAEKEVYADGKVLTTNFRYNFLGQKTASTDFYGNETLYKYDELGRLVQTIYPPTKDVSTATVSSGYDVLDQTTAETNERGHTTTYRKTILGKPYHTAYADGSSEANLYDVDGFKIKSVAKNGTYTLYENDYQGRSTKKSVYTPSGELLQTTAATFNAFHKLSETDAAGSITNSAFDGSGRLIREWKNDTEIVIGYDNLGREKERHERYGDNADDIIVKRKEYDLLDRVIHETTANADGTLVEEQAYGYDEYGNRNELITYNQAGESIQRTTYDAHKNPIVITDALGHSTITHISYSHVNDLGQCVPYEETVDPLGNCSVTISDTRARVAVKLRKNAVGEVIQKQEFIYDQSGNRCRWVETVVTPGSADRAVVTAWCYDSMNRISEIIEAAETPEAKHTRITFNKAGQKEHVEKPDGIIISHRYDFLGRLESVASSDDTVHYLYSYDALDNPITVQDLIHGRTTLKTYDANNRLSEEVLGHGSAIRYSSDRLGRHVRIELPDGSSQQFIYNGAQLAEVQRLTSQGALTYHHRYTQYDLSGHLIESELAGNQGSLSFNYDLLGRPIEIRTNNCQETVQYDPVGNLIQRDVRDAQGTVECCYVYDDLYQLQSETGVGEHEYQNDSLYNRVHKDNAAIAVNDLNQVLSDEANIYNYDPNGNLILQTGSRNFEYVYDALDRLVSVKTPSQDVLYAYDEGNRRLLKTFMTKEGEVVQAIHYLYIGDNEVGVCTPQGALSEFRLLGSLSDGERGSAVGVELDGHIFAPVHDIQGSLAALFSVDGSEATTYRYTAFGECETYGPFATLCHWRFSSKRFDEETDLIYFGRRYYSPSQGRWITCDPAGFDDEPNLYAYVLNSPLTHFDAFGLYAHPVPSLQTEQQRNDDQVKGAIVKTLFTGPSKTAHYDPAFANSSFGQGKVQVRTIGDRPTQNVRIGFINGINNSFDDACRTARHYSQLLDGRQIDLVYNPTNGLVNDAIRYVSTTRCGTITSVVADLHRTWDGHLLNSPSNNIYVQIGHSGGCSDIDVARQTYPEELRQRIVVVAIAPGAYIKKGLLKDVKHYVSERDPVRFFDRQGRNDCADTTTVLKPHPKAPLFDHGATSPTLAVPVTREIMHHVNSGNGNPK